MNKKILVFSFLAIGALGIVGANAASAQGWFSRFGSVNADPRAIVERQEARFEHQAEMLGISPDEVKAKWAEGKTPLEIAEELGISQEEMREKIRAERKQHFQERLQILVDNGVITQAQAKARIQAMEERLANGDFGHRMGARLDRGIHKTFGLMGGNK